MTLNIHENYVVEAGQTLSFSDVPNTESAIEFKAKGQPLILDNFGMIDVDNSPRWAIHGSRQQGADVFWNHAGGVLRVEWTGESQGFSLGIALESDGSQIRNDGDIEVSGSEGRAASLEGEDSRLVNTGDISVTATAYGSCIYVNGFAKNTGTLTVQGAEVANVAWVLHDFVNTGQIHAEADYARGVVVDLFWADPSAPGIDATLRNSGSIIAVSQDVANPSTGILFISPIEGREFRIVNSGRIEADTAIGNGADSWTPRLHLDNSGELVGAILCGLAGGIVNNTGSITGDVSLGLVDDVYRGGHGHLTGSLYGWWGADKLTGGVEGNVFYGDMAAPDARDGADLLQGRGGDDTLYGGGGGDTLSGGAGADLLTGDTGADVFRFERADVSTPLASDLITDLASGDIIDLSQIDADATQTGDQAFTLVGGFGGHAGELTLSYDSGAGVTLLEGDIDGDGQSDFEIRMTGDQTGFTGIVL